MASRGDCGSQEAAFPDRGCARLDSGASGLHSSGQPGLLCSMRGQEDTQAWFQELALFSAVGGNVFEVNNA